KLAILCAFIGGTRRVLLRLGHPREPDLRGHPGLHFQHAWIRPDFDSCPAIGRRYDGQHGCDQQHRSGELDSGSGQSGWLYPQANGHTPDGLWPGRWFIRFDDYLNRSRTDHTPTVSRGPGDLRTLVEPLSTAAMCMIRSSTLHE